MNYQQPGAKKKKKGMTQELHCVIPTPQSNYSVMLILECNVHRNGDQNEPCTLLGLHSKLLRYLRLRSAHRCLSTDDALLMKRVRT